MTAEIVPGSQVTLHFSLALTDGTVAISTFGEEPLSFTMGDHTFRPGLELALYGLRAGATQTLQLTPEQAYGLRDRQLIQAMARGDFAADMQPEAGQIIAFTLPDGEETAGLILAIEGDAVSVDFNHPLAGQEVVFTVEIIAVEPAG